MPDVSRAQTLQRNTGAEKSLQLTMPPNEAPLASFYPGEDERHSSAPTVARVQDDQIRVEDKLYSTKKLAELHPGGPLFIKVRDETNKLTTPTHGLTIEISTQLAPPGILWPRCFSSVHIVPPSAISPQAHGAGTGRVG